MKDAEKTFRKAIEKANIAYNDVMARAWLAYRKAKAPAEEEKT